ncbi:MAG: glycine--tRNA ligase subunit beta [Holosporales bacterium]|jgi:glycyl-tRNA synthetase beta chain|nr:glycine--tRNA ligase subunit beta [Holosporales bacterium]
MRQELLLEFFSEEIPAKLQQKAVLDAKETFVKILHSYGAEFREVNSFISPRRITIQVSFLIQKTRSLREEKRGPKISAPSSAINGFLNANGKDTSDLIERDGYYYLDLATEGLKTRELIGDMIEDFILKMPWSKSMRWYLEKEKTLSAFWVRPIRSILCIYDTEPLEIYIKSVGLTTCSYTFGHRFLSPGKIQVSDFEDYKRKLEENHVMLDYEKKKNCIDKEITKKAASIGLHMLYDIPLLEEVAGLVEWPFVHIGSIDEKFMKLPLAVLSTSMKVHQKYFTLTYAGSVISPFFGTVTNVPGTDVMYSGFDRVLRARLSDAAFFYKEDLDVTLEAFAQRLSNVVFHEKLGSIAQKVDRMMSIANTREEHRTIALCKADLLTQMVGEFPELQGLMGEIYAKAQGEDSRVCTAIKEHYEPVNTNSNLPYTITGARVSFFDKLDTLVGLLGVGLKPTGSRDPLALRRIAFSIVRLLCDFRENVLTDGTLSWYIETLIDAYSEQGIALEHNTIEIVCEFLIDRLKTYIMDKFDIDSEIVDSVIKSFRSLDFDYRKAIVKAQDLKRLIESENFQIIKEAYKRAIGLIERRFANLTVDSICSIQFENPYMMHLQNSISNQETNPRDISIAVKAAEAVLTACDNVLINDENVDIRLNNLRLIKRFVELVNENIGNLEEL